MRLRSALTDIASHQPRAQLNMIGSAIALFVTCLTQAPTLVRTVETLSSMPRIMAASPYCKRLAVETQEDGVWVLDLESKRVVLPGAPSGPRTRKPKSVRGAASIACTAPTTSVSNRLRVALAALLLQRTEPSPRATFIAWAERRT